MIDAFTYVISNKSHTLYVGWTTDLIKRVAEHKNKTYPSSFTARYHFDRLVWFEVQATQKAAWQREQQIKGWLRARKVALIQARNPNWLDLSIDWRDVLSF